MENRSEWLELRKSGIGGSDVAAALGLSKWKSQVGLWLEKTGRDNSEVDNDAMRLGRYLEPFIAELYCEKMGCTYYKSDAPVFSVYNKWMLANPDGITSQGRLLEVKTASSTKEWGDEFTDQVPIGYLLQVQHYLSILGLQECHIAVLFFGRTLKIYTVLADYELQKAMINRLAEFWNYVVTDTMPPPESYQDCKDAFSQHLPRGVVDADSDILECIKNIKELNNEVERCNMKIDKERTKLVSFLAKKQGDELVSEFGETLATWKKAKGKKTLDYDRLFREHPDIQKSDYEKIGEESRRLVVK